MTIAAIAVIAMIVIIAIIAVVAATVVILLAIFVMQRFDWFKLDIQRQVVKVQVPPEARYQQDVADVLVRHTREFELVSVEAVRGGALSELFYSVLLKPGVTVAELIEELGAVNTGQKVTVLTGYDQTDM